MKTPSWFLKKNLIAFILLPVSLVYFIISKSVYFSRSFRAKSSKRPVICVGNILAGGVGKTPIVQEIAKNLDAPVIMRGYKGGDEAKMLQKAGILVFVGDRIKSINYLNSIKKAGPIIMDDGFQNPTIKKDISILVFDGKIGDGNSFLLPAGPLREPLSAINRADAVIIIRQKAEGGRQKLTEKIKEYNKPIFYAENKTRLPSAICHLPFIAFAGIGYPQKFFDNLPKKPVRSISFPDHYQYTEADLNKLFALAKKENAELITTMKDWVRLPPYAQKKIKVAKLETTIEPAFYNWLHQEL